MALHIPDHLAEFRDKSMLVIVAGGKTGKIYAVSGGTIEEVADIPSVEIHYSDKEEHWASGGRGQFLGSGATGDTLDRQEKAEFKRNLSKAIEQVWKPVYDTVFILASEWDKEAVLDSLPPQSRGRVVIGRLGNFVRKSPIEILEIIAEESALSA